MGTPGPVTERVTVSQFRDLEPDVQQAAFAAAADVGAGAALLHGGTLGLYGWYRNGVAQALAPAGGQWPMSSAAVEPASAVELYGQAVGDNLAAGHAVISRTSAGLFGMTAGDVIVLRNWSGGITSFAIGAVVDDTQLPAELVVSTASAGAMGFVRPTSVQIYGFSSRQAVKDALAARGLARSDVRIGNGGAGATTPDATLGLAETKAKLGQFWYVPRGDGCGHHRSGLGGREPRPHRLHRDPDRRHVPPRRHPGHPGSAQRDRRRGARRRHRHRQHQPLRRLLRASRGSQRREERQAATCRGTRGAWRST